MRTALAAATVLATTSLVGVGAAPAQATECTAHVGGWDISGIVLKHGATCDHAKQVIHHVFSVAGVHAIGWRCNDPASRSWKQYSCWATNHSGHAIEFLAHEQGSTGGF